MLSQNLFYSPGKAAEDVVGAGRVLIIWWGGQLTIPTRCSQGANDTTVADAISHPTSAMKDQRV
jgi:hypothetical protein